MTRPEARIVWNTGTADISHLDAHEIADAINLARRTIRCEESEFRWVKDCIESSVSPSRIGSYHALCCRQDSRLVGLVLFRKRPLTETVYEIFQVIALPDASSDVPGLLVSAVISALAHFPCTLLLMELPCTGSYSVIQHALLKQDWTSLGDIPDLFTPGTGASLFAKPFDTTATHLPCWQPTLGLPAMPIPAGPASIIPLAAADRERAISLVKLISSFSDEEKLCLVELVDEFVHEGSGSSYRFLGSFNHGELVGLVCFGKRPMTVGAFDGYWLCTHPRFRRAGVGRSLMEALERSVVEAGGYLVLLETSESSKYLPARALFESMGYKEGIRLPDFYSAGDGLVVFQKYLGQTRSSGPGKRQ